MTYLLWISYKGTNYAGFQVQPNAPTVCAVLQDAMQAVLGQRPDVKGCSRTDAGVHARRFALSFCYTGKYILLLHNHLDFLNTYQVFQSYFQYKHLLN